MKACDELALLTFHNPHTIPYTHLAPGTSHLALRPSHLIRHTPHTTNQAGPVAAVMGRSGILASVSDNGQDVTVVFMDETTGLASSEVTV